MKYLTLMVYEQVCTSAHATTNECRIQPSTQVVTGFQYFRFLVGDIRVCRVRVCDKNQLLDASIYPEKRPRSGIDLIQDLCVLVLASER